MIGREHTSASSHAKYVYRSGPASNVCKLMIDLSVDLIFNLFGVNAFGSHSPRRRLQWMSMDDDK